MKSTVLIGILSMTALQFVPGPKRSNPPVVAGRSLFDNAVVPRHIQDVLRRSCMDCHSNETRWPWYSSVPLVSWLIEHDVSEGRAQLNFSTWQEYSTFERADLLDKVCEKATKREMPLWQYRLLHRESRLNTPDVVALCTWSRREAARLVAAGP